jgi:hypothetical protein
MASDAMGAKQYRRVNVSHESYRWQRSDHGDTCLGGGSDSDIEQEQRHKGMQRTPLHSVITDVLRVTWRSRSCSTSHHHPQPEIVQMGANEIE